MKKTLQECKEIVAKNLTFNNWDNLMTSCDKHTFHICTDLANKMYYEQSEWISVEDALPENNQYMLVMTKRGWFRIDYYHNGEWAINEKEVTHWHQLPNPPQK